MTIVIFFLIIFIVWFYACPYKAAKIDVQCLERKEKSYRNTIDKYEKIIARYGYIKFRIKGTKIYTCQVDNDNVIIFDLINKACTINVIEVVFGEYVLFNIPLQGPIYVQSGDSFKLDITKFLAEDLPKIRKFIGSTAP